MATFTGFEGYGGATITRVIDGAGAVWIGMCAKRNGIFGFYVFKNGANVPISPFCSGRGSVSKDGTWIAWEGSQHFEGALPGFVPLPHSAPIAIPADGALAQLYIGVYVAADFDTPAETALRVQKQLDAIQELTELLKRAGVLA